MHDQQRRELQQKLGRQRGRQQRRQQRQRQELEQQQQQQREGGVIELEGGMSQGRQQQQEWEARWDLLSRQQQWDRDMLQRQQARKEEQLGLKLQAEQVQGVGRSPGGRVDRLVQLGAYAHDRGRFGSFLACSPPA